MLKKCKKRPLKNSEVITILVTYFVVLGLLLSYSFKLEKKLEPKRKEYVDQFINSNDYNISHLFVFESENDRKEIMLGYIAYTKEYYDIETSTFYDINKKDIDGLRKYLPKEYKYKLKLNINEIIEIENNINNENILKRKLS